jgi:hypothetical protein
MLECALAAFACHDALCCPAALEIGAGNAQLVDDATYFWIVGIAGHGGSELGDYTVCASWPIPYQRSGFGSEEDVSQEVALAIGVEPACEEAGCFPVPATRIPRAIENVGRAVDRVDAAEHGLGWFVAVTRTVCRRRRAAPARRAGASAAPRKCAPLSGFGALTAWRGRAQMTCRSINAALTAHERTRRHCSFGRVWAFCREFTYLPSSCAARYAGLTGSSDESGKRRRKKGLARPGKASVCTGMIQFAWRALQAHRALMTIGVRRTGRVAEPALSSCLRIRWVH